MKDAYSFHATLEDCQREYQNMFDAYSRIFDRCGLSYRPVEADTGAIGGTMSHEFQVLASSGEDAVVSCNSCSYAANVEKAELPAPIPSTHSNNKKISAVETPGHRTIQEVSTFLGEAPERFLKTLVYTTDTGATVVAVVRGDQELSEPKLKNLLGCEWVVLAGDEAVQTVAGAPPGFVGPIGIKATMLGDKSLKDEEGMICGANEIDKHLVHVNIGRDIPALKFGDLRLARAGDGCPRCNQGTFDEHRGIEVGQTFYLGKKYSQAMNAGYLDAEGKQHAMEMGCYGIGITRTMAAAIEQNHDEAGIIWPKPLAPLDVHIVPINWDDESTRNTAEEIYSKLQRAGIEVLLDNRRERPGVKFKDADLLGIPLRVTIGGKSLGRGVIELRRRKDGQNSEIQVSQAVEVVESAIRN